MEKNFLSNKVKEFFNKPYSSVMLDKYLKAYELDKNRYTLFQLWELMNIFGSYMYHGNLKLPFDCDIFINECDF